MKKFLNWLGLSKAKYHDWKQRVGLVNRHNGLIPRRVWLLEWERKAIEAYAIEHPLEGYRRLTFMMLDADIVAVSPSSVYRVLKKAGLLQRQGSKSSRKGDGFQHPEQPHEHGSISMFLISILPGLSITCARFLMATVAILCIGRFANRCWNSISRSPCNELENVFRKPRRELFPIMVRNLLLKTSRNTLK